MGWSSPEHEKDSEQEAGSLAAPLQAPDAPSVAFAGGNRAFGQMVSRMGDGIMPGGTVHPDVANEIGRARGSGTSLPADVQERVGPAIGDPLDDVKVHTDSNANALAHSVAARAFTTGSDVFFAAGEYQPHTSEGSELLAHELTHVAQQRGAPTSGPMTVSEPGEPLEQEAESVAKGLHG